MSNEKQKGVSPHFTAEELKERYLGCKDPIERTHWQIIWLLVQTDAPKTPQQVAEVVGYSVNWVRTLRRRYNAEGAAGLENKRKHNGRRALISDAQQKALQAALSAPPTEGGLWTGPKVAAWLQQLVEKPVSVVTGWRYLRKLGFTLQMPLPQHEATATAETQQAFKKNSRPRCRPAVPMRGDIDRNLGRRRESVGVATDYTELT